MSRKTLTNAVGFGNKPVKKMSRRFIPNTVSSKSPKYVPMTKSTFDDGVLLDHDLGRNNADSPCHTGECKLTQMM